MLRPRHALAVAALLAPAGARAGNGDLPRTPMVHLGEQCLTVVDRSQDPVVHLRYTVPLTDVCLTADELPGSRTHQMVAFCHGDPPARILPHWHTRAEADEAAAAGLASPTPVPAADILAENPDYADCWTPLFPAAERRSITCAAARPGVDWDTTGLARGAYVVRGYTYEPPLNTWSPRRGIFKVVDGPDPADAPPAVGFADGETYLWKDQPMRVHLCVDAMDGSTLDLAHGPSVGDPAWTDVLVDEPVSTGAVTLEFVPPASVAGQFITLRATITDPADRTFVAHMQGEIKVELVPDPAAPGTTGEPGTTTGDDDPTTGDPYDFCAENPDADKPPMCPDPSTTGASSSSSDETGAAESGDGGCCSVQGPPSPLALLALLGLRRRRRGSVARWSRPAPTTSP